jgi:hypothetical protein
VEDDSVEDLWPEIKNKIKEKAPIDEYSGEHPEIIKLRKKH